MDGIVDALGALTVTEKVLIGVGVLLVGAVVVAALLSRFVGWRLAFGGLGVTLFALVVMLVLWPVSTGGLGAQPQPAPSVEAAVARFQAERAAIGAPLSPLCEPQILSHGKKVARAVVLLHGVSSCPRAFVDFAPILHERGYNVVTALLPEHGFADRGADALSRVSAQALVRAGSEAVDVADGLGEEVIVLGISAGGTMAAFLAQTRPDVARVVLVAPFFGLGAFGPRVNRVLMRTMLVLPDVSIWKDPVLRGRFTGGMAHAYIRQSTTATAEIMRLGLATLRDAQQEPPAVHDIVAIMNAADTAVSNASTEEVLDAWAQKGVAVTRYMFPARHQLGHELIDPEEPGADTALTYPVLLELLDAPIATTRAGVQ